MNEQCFYQVCEDNLVREVKFDDGTSVTLIDYVGSSYRPVEAARVSYNLNDRSKGYEKDFELLQRLMNDGHLGPFEHISMTVLIETPIFIARQIMRHRTFSFNEISRRYTKSWIKFWSPQVEHIRFNIDEWTYDDIDDAIKLIVDSYDYSYKKYKELLNLGVAKEVARAVLPMGLMTKFYMSGNVRNWLHFLDLRLNEHAQFEAREVGQGVEQILKSIYPHVHYAWKQAKNRGVW